MTSNLHVMIINLFLIFNGFVNLILILRILIKMLTILKSF
jgi:hypothetical protein